MKFKIIVAWLLVLIICFPFTSCAKNNDINNCSSFTESKVESEILSDNSNDVKSAPLLYKATDNNGTIVWLFGSIHVGRDDYYPLPDYILNAFNSSETLAVEADIIAFENDISKQTNALSCMLYLDGTTIKDHIPQDLYSDAVEILTEYNVYMSLFDYYKPSLWVSLIESMQYENMGINIELGIDRYLIKQATENNKDIYEIESAEFQYNMMSNFSDELQILLLDETVKSHNEPETLKNDLKLIMDLWSSGDEKEFSKYLKTDTSKLTEEELTLFNEYNNAMIVNRNINMTNYAENSLKSDKETFICVGAAHIIGDGAMVDLLQKRGYKVELVTN